ncbi:hypothetical protein ACL6C3_03000 [Capilliphycus salinus ALCB114379]|uniref:hypothetical protein n=1 Tax=Capilliphycus salinus TaxID=2768948 RepID=UPI0039A64DE6
MSNQEALTILERTGLRQRHFADLIRAAQIIFDPSGGITGRVVNADWREFGIPVEVEENLKILGEKYRYASPHLPMDEVWEQLLPETRSWFIENKNELWMLEEAFPALDED